MTTDVISVNCPPPLKEFEQESASLSKRRRLLDDDSDGGETNVRPRRRRKMLKRRRRRPKAPINTTQFLMNDMKSISPTSDWERFNQSDSDTEEYEQKEFTKDYNKESSRLVEMYRHDLIKEYLSLEKTVSSIERQYTALHARGRRALPCDNDVLEKIRIFQQEIHAMEAENLDLAAENARLRAESSQAATQSNSDSSDSSTSDSDSSSSSDSDSSSSDEEDDDVDKKFDDINPKDDTGYESDTNNLEVSSST